MKIVFINSYYSPDIGGGAEVTLKLLAETMQQRGHEVLVICRGRAEGLSDEFIDGVRVVRVGVPGMYFPLEKEVQRSSVERLVWHWRDRHNRKVASLISGVLHEFAPDVSSCHNLSGLSVSVWGELAEQGIPIVQVLHDQYLLCAKTSMVKKDKVCDRPCLDCSVLRFHHASYSSKVTSVIGVSRYILDKLVSRGYFKNSRHHHVIRNVRRPELWDHFSRCERTGNRKDFVFGFIGTLSPIKGIEQLLAAFSSANLPDSTRLLIAGSGTKDYVSQLKNRYPDPRFEWLGYSSTRSFFEKIDVLVVPSVWHDTLPGVVFESFGFGVPVLGSNRGGIPEMIEPGINGILFDPEVPGELESLLLRVSSDYKIIEGMKDSTLLSAAPYRDVNAWSERYENAYHGAISEMAIYKELQEH